MLWVIHIDQRQIRAYWNVWRQIKSRSHILFNDFELNTENNVYLNIYQNFVLTAVKVHRYIRSRGVKLSKNPKFIKGKRNDSEPDIVADFVLDCIWHMICCAHSDIKTKGSQEVAKNAGGHCGIHQAHVIWCVLINDWYYRRNALILFKCRLGYSAFYNIFNQKVPCNIVIAKHFKEVLLSTHYKKSKKRFSKLVWEGNKGMLHIKY